MEKTESRKSEALDLHGREIRRMLERAGFGVLNLYGSLSGSRFVLGSDELLRGGAGYLERA